MAIHRGASGAGSEPELHFGPYITRSVIGRGSMGIVYEARHQRLDGRYALKAMHGMLAGDALHRERFLREAQALAEVHHPHVVKIVDSGIDQGRPFIVMELLEGHSLATLLSRQGPLRPADLAELFLPVFSAVAAIHARGIVHRDLKPGNVMLAPRGGPVPEPVLLDFGVSRLSGGPLDETEITRSEALLGTLQYLSPEQLRNAKTAGAASDQYALGVMLYECATGHRPFAGSSHYDLMHAIVTAPVPRPSAHVPALSREFDVMVMRAMGRDPASRYPSVRALASALLSFGSKSSWSRWGEFAGVDATPPGESPTATVPDYRPGGPVEEPPARRRATPWVAAAAGLAMVAAVAVGSRMVKRSMPAPVATAPPARTAAAPVSDERPAAPVATEPAVKRRETPPHRPSRKTAARPSGQAPPAIADELKVPPPPAASAPPAAPAPGTTGAATGSTAPSVGAPSPSLATVASGAPRSAGPEAVTRGDGVYSVRPLSPVPPPHLARVLRAHDQKDLDRALLTIEQEAVKAGCSPGFTRGITGALGRSLSGREAPEIYPAAAYYLIVREAARGREKEVTAQELASAHRSGFLKKHLMSLPALEPP